MGRTRRARSRGWPTVGQRRPDLLEVRRSTEKVPLSVLDTEVLHRVELALALDPLCDDERIHLPRHDLECARHLPLDVTAVDATHEAHVELQVLGLQARHLLEARIARTDVVHSDLEAHVGEVLHRFHEDGVVVDGVLLRHLEDDVGRAQAEPAEKPDQGRPLEVRVVHRRREDIDEELGPGRQVLAVLEGLVSAEAVDLEGEIGRGRVLEQPHGARLRGPHGPAGQGLVAEDSRLLEGEDRLEQSRDVSRQQDLLDPHPVLESPLHPLDTHCLPGFLDETSHQVIGKDQGIVEDEAEARGDVGPLAEIGRRDPREASVQVLTHAFGGGRDLGHAHPAILITPLRAEEDEKGVAAPLVHREEVVLTDLASLELVDEIRHGDEDLAEDPGPVVALDLGDVGDIDENEAQVALLHQKGGEAVQAIAERRQLRRHRHSWLPF